MKNNNLYNEIKDMISKNYLFIEGQEETWKERLKSIESEEKDVNDVFHKIDSMVLALEDPHTRYYKTSKVDELFDIDCVWVNNKMIIMPNILGYKSEIIGGELLSINNTNIDSINAMFEDRFKGFPRSIIKEETLKYIKTELDTKEINIEVKKDDNIILEKINKISLDDIRQKFVKEMEVVKQNNEPVLMKDLGNNILLIKIFSFRRKGIVEYILSKSELINKNKVLIFDIRNNRGGFIEETKELVSKIIEKDVELDYKILSKSSLNNENEKIYQNHENIFSNKDIFIACDEYTMSSAEFIFIRGLKKGYENVKVIGSYTAGMSGQAKLFPLSSGDMLQITIKKYIGKDNREIKEGYSPDIIIELESEDYFNNNDKVIDAIKTICK